jgi:putative two-component system response regulator
MSPEQAAGEPLGPATDLYSLAVVAYEMLTGRVPFQGDTPAATLLSHLNKQMPPIRELDGELSGHAESALSRALAKAPQERFGSARELVEALTPAAWPTPNIGAPNLVTSASILRTGSARNAPRVLVVDDGTANRELIEACLAGVDCEVRLAADGYQALDTIAAWPPDLVLLDVQMPGMDGYEVCRRIKADPKLRLVPVVMITALNQTDDRVMALDSGADDFMAKPVERIELIARVKSALRLKAVYDRLDTAEQIIFALAAAVEAKDLHTKLHTQRVALSARQVGAQMGMSDVELDILFQGGMLHDVGKIGIDDAILRKPGPLDPDELMKIRMHPLIGIEIIRPLRMALDIVPTIRNHHEWFDGRGYPDGLRDYQIPLHAKIVAVCDAFDSMVSARPYRPARPVEEAIRILVAGAGKQWDPGIVNRFVTDLPTIRALTAA